MNQINNMNRINNSNMQQTQKPKNKPACDFYHDGIRAAVWKNQKQNQNGQVSDYFTVTFERKFKTGNDWKSSSSFNVSDLLKLSHVVQEVYRQLTSAEQQQEAQS